MSDQTLPAGISALPPQVEIGECQDCGRFPTEDYTLHLGADNYLAELRDMEWGVIDDRLLCFDCVLGICPDCEKPRGTDPECTECQP